MSLPKCAGFVQQKRIPQLADMAQMWRSQCSGGPPRQGRCGLDQPGWSVLLQHSIEAYLTSSQMSPAESSPNCSAQSSCLTAHFSDFFLPQFLHLPFVILEGYSRKLSKPFPGVCPGETHTKTKLFPRALLNSVSSPF